MKTLIKMKLQLLFMLLTVFGYAQVGINTATPEESSVLDLSSDDKAFLPTRLDDENSITNPVDGMIYYDKNLNCFRGRANGVWVDFGGCPPPKLPDNVTLTAGQIKFIASVFDNDYFPYTEPTEPAKVGALDAGGGTETQVDIQGVLTTTGISVLIPYNNANTSPTIIDEFSQVVSVPVTLQEVGTKSINVVLSYPQTELPEDSTGNLTATIRALTTDLNVVKLDINKGIGDDGLGVLLAEFTIATDDSLGTGPVQLRAIAGIPDRNFFTDVEHQFLYVPVLGEDGNYWLNNNLGAYYADRNHPNFNPAQQGTAFNDHLAYGSLYQWGRLSDGHELIKWTGATTGTPVNGTTTTLSTSDTPENPEFIITSYPWDWRNSKNDDLWQGENGINNPCPVGYRLPTEAEMNTLVSAEGITNRETAASSNLAFTCASLRTSTTGELSSTGLGGLYWSSTVSRNLARVRYFAGSGTTVGSFGRANGYSVRCLKD